jgi:hypothetical protein
MSTLETAFQSGQFLSSLPTSSSFDAQRKVKLTLHRDGSARHSFPYEESGAFAQTSELSLTLPAMTSSHIFAYVASLSRLVAQVVPLLVKSRPVEGWKSMENILKRLKSMSSLIELHWAQSPMASVDSDDDIGKLSARTSNQVFN